MSTVDTVKAEIEKILTEMEKNVDWIEREGPKIIDALLNVYLDTFPLARPVVNPIAERAKQELAKLVRYARSTISLARAEIQYVGSPDTLRDAASTIESKLIDPARALASELVLGKIPSSLPANYSDGVASDSYRAAIDGRDSAVLGIETYAAPVVDALNDHADSIEEYYRTVRDAILAVDVLIVSIVAVIVGWETIVVGVFGIIGIVLSVIQLVALFSDLTETVNDTIEATRSAFEKTIIAWPAVLT